MGHNIKAIIGKRDDVQRFADDRSCAKVIGLPQDMGMVLLTTSLLDELSELYGEYPCLEPESPDSTVVGILEQYSLRTKLAYIETDYFGGVGTQGGVLYADGRETIAARVGEGIINAFLKELGVLKQPDKDEFDSLELWKYRYMDE